MTSARGGSSGGCIVVWPGGAAKVFPPRSGPGIEKSRRLLTATTLLRWNMGKDSLHGAFQAHENLRPLLWSHADDMPCIGIDRLSVAASRIGQQFHETGSKLLSQSYPRRDGACYVRGAKSWTKRLWRNKREIGSWEKARAATPRLTTPGLAWFFYFPQGCQLWVNSAS